MEKNCPHESDLPQLFPFYSAFDLVGPDSLKFAQGQFTSDILSLNVGESTWTAHCNLQGRMESMGMIQRWEDRLRYFVPTDILRHAAKHLKQFSTFSDVTFERCKTSVMIQSSETPPYWIFSLDSDTTHPSEMLTNPVASIDPNEYSEHTRNILFQWIQQGIPWLTAKTVGKFIPLEWELEKRGGVSFEKGCYLGQEIIARLHYRGTLKKKLTYRQQHRNPFNEDSTCSLDFPGELVCAVEQNSMWHMLVLSPIAKHDSPER
jgi:folate-binding protein YgfZ